MPSIGLARAHLSDTAHALAEAACESASWPTLDLRAAASPTAVAAVLASLARGQASLPLELLRLWRRLPGQPPLLLLCDDALRVPCASAAAGRIFMLGAPVSMDVLRTRLRMALAPPLPIGPSLPPLQGAYLAAGLWLRCRASADGPHLFHWDDGGLTAVLGPPGPLAADLARALAAGDWQGMRALLPAAAGAVHLCPQRGWLLAPPPTVDCLLHNIARLPARHRFQGGQAPTQLLAETGDVLWLGPAGSMPTPGRLQAAEAMPDGLPFALCVEALP